MNKENVSPFTLGNSNPLSQYFIGKSYYSTLTSKEAQIDISNVIFEPGCRNNWHIHHDCQQILVCVGGNGWYQEWGKEPVMLKVGDVIEIPLDTKYWHGATKDSYFAHLSVMSNVIAGSHEWLEEVEDPYYYSL